MSARRDDEINEAAVVEAVDRFYAALDALVTGRGCDPMIAAWHHTDRVTAAHPLGEWSYGWEEILATWEVVAQLGKPENGGAEVRSLQVRVYGDVAYSTCVYVAGPAFGRTNLNCTNVLVRSEGGWKVVHHHADKSLTIERGLEVMADAGAGGDGSP